MKAAEVISNLKARGVELWQEGGTLRYRAPAGALTDREKADLKAHKSAFLKALSTTATIGSTPVAGPPAVTEPLPNHTEPSEPEPKDRLCCQCQHFAMSSYGYPLGLCQQHNDRIQHSTSQPPRFGCGDFKLKEERS